MTHAYCEYKMNNFQIGLQHGLSVSDTFAISLNNYLLNETEAEVFCFEYLWSLVPTSISCLQYSLARPDLPVENATCI